MQLAEFCERVLALLELTEAGPFSPEDNLYDAVGLDSFQAFQLIINVESLAGADVPPVELPAMYTLRDAYGYYLVLRDLDPAATIG
jgi:acyl carrier protein